LSEIKREEDFDPTGYSRPANSHAGQQLYLVHSVSIIHTLHR